MTTEEKDNGWLIELEKLCKEQDWYYYHADDHNAFYEGLGMSNKINKVLQILGNSQVAKDIYNKYAPEEMRML